MNHKKLSERGLTVSGGKSQKVGVLQGFLNPAPGRASFWEGTWRGASLRFGLDPKCTLDSFSQCFGGHQANLKLDERLDDAPYDGTTKYHAIREVCAVK